MKESGRNLARVLATTLILASCRPAIYPDNPTPPPATSAVPAETLPPGTKEYQLPITEEEKIYYQTLFDTQEFLTDYVKSPELQTCIMSVLEKQQFLKDFRESSDEIKDEENFYISYGIRNPDGTPKCIMTIYYVSNSVRAIKLETNLFSLFPNQLTRFASEENPKSIPVDKLIEVANEIFDLPKDVKWQDVNLSFSRIKNPGKIARGNSDSGGYLETLLSTEGQSGFFLQIPKIKTNL